VAVQLFYAGRFLGTLEEIVLLQQTKEERNFWHFLMGNTLQKNFRLKKNMEET